jgi:hypothetical protein
MLLWRAAGCPEPKSTVSHFRDIPAGSYYEDAVLWAVENGITTGATSTTFAPNATVSRAQVVTLLYRAEGMPDVGESSFGDVPSGIYYEDAVQWAVSSGITNGTGSNQFSPNSICTRAQIVTFLYRDLAE